MQASVMPIQKYLSFVNYRAEALMDKALLDASFFSQQLQFVYPVYLTACIVEELRWTPFDDQEKGPQSEGVRVKDLHHTLYLDLKIRMNEVQHLSHSRVPRIIFGANEIIFVKAMITAVNDVQRVILVAKPDEEIF